MTLVILYFIFIIGYTGLFHHLVLHEYYFIPVDIIIGIVLGALTLLIVVIMHIPFFRLLKSNNRYKHFYIRQVFELCFFFMHVKLDVKGLENVPKENFVVYSNHKSQADILAIYLALKRPITFVSKPSVFKVPFLSATMKSIACVPINRENDREAAKAIIKAVNICKESMSIIIFPEGTRTSKDYLGMLDYHHGSYKLAMKANAPVLPITILNTAKINDNVFFKKTKVSVVIHKPITSEEYKDMNTTVLGDKTKEIINSII